MITKAEYTQSFAILAIVDGLEMTVPNDTANRHRIMITEWEAAGNMIVPYESAGIDLVSYAADKRWQKETGGFELSGLHIATDDRSKLMISGARVAAEADPEFTTSWKAADGAFVLLNAGQIIAISNAVLSHVSDCFTIEAQVLSQIDDGTITERAQIDAAFA